MLQLAIYSPADRLQPHRYKADESYEISGPDMTPVQSYLDVEAIIALAKQQNVDAIHPGYGFLSENTTFARRCKEEGIVFIGPSAKTIEVVHPFIVCTNVLSIMHNVSSLRCTSQLFSQLHRLLLQCS